MNRLLRVSLIVVGVVVLLGVAAKLYLRSGYVAAQVASRLQALYGGHVRVAAADIGVAGSSVRGVELFEKGKTDSQKPWLTVASVSADVSVLGVLSGSATPGNVTLTGAEVSLRFDKEGRLLTKLPEPKTGEPEKPATLPNLRVEKSRVTLQQEGGPALVVSGIHATLTKQGEHLVLAGAADNPDRAALGKWTVKGDFDPKAKTATVILASDRPLHVTQEMLNELPFVPAKVWKEVQAEGDTPVTVTVRFDLAGKDIHYRVDLDPQNTTVRVPAVELVATGAYGKVIIDDGRVELRDVQGQAFGGTIRARGDVDFRKPDLRLHFPDVEANGLVVRQLPKSWDVPRQIEGRLRGKAWIDVVWAKGKPVIRGEGKGEIVDARVAGQPAEPVELELHAREGGLGFRTPADAPKKQAEGPALLLPVLYSTTSYIQNLQPADAPLPARAVNGMAVAVKQTLEAVREAGTELARFLPRQMNMEDWKKKTPGRSISVNLKMQKVDLAKFVEGLGLKLPFAVGGRLSFQVKTSIPLDTSGDLKTYRAEGSAEAAPLRLAGIELDELRGNVLFADGVLTVNDVTGQISEGKGKPGTYKGSARLQVVPLGELTANLDLDRIPLSRAAVLAQAADQVRGDLSGSVRVRAPGARLGDVTAWEATAKITTRNVRAFGWVVQDSAAQARLHDGLLTLPEVRLRVEGAPVVGSAELRLAAPYPFQGKITLKGWDLAALQRLSPEMKPPVPVAGRLDTTVSVEGSLQPLSVRTTGTATARNLKVSDVPLNDVRLTWKSDNDRLTLEQIHARVSDGSVDGKAVVPLKADVAGSVELKLKDVDVGALARAVPKMPFKVEGKAGGTVKGTLPPAPAGKEREASLDVDIRAPRLKVQGIPTEQLAGTVGYHRGTLDYQLQGKALGGTFELNGQYPQGKEGKEGRLQVKGAHLSGLAVAFGRRPEQFPLRGTVDVDVKFRHERAGGFPAGGGNFVILRPRWGDVELADQIRGNVLLERQELELRDISANVGEGTLRARMAFSLGRPGLGWFTASLDGVEAAALLAPWPDLAGKIQGRVEARLRGRLNHEWNGSGDVLLGRGKVFGAEVTDWRLPLTWSYSPNQGRGELSVHDAHAQVGPGRVTGQATLGWGTALRLDGNVRFAGVDLRAVSRPSGSSQFVSGLVTGQVAFAGQDMRSLDEVTGTVRAKLTNAQAFQAPVLSQVAPFLGIQTSFAFDRGELRARLSRGAVHIEDLTLWGSSLRLLVLGSVTYAGRLDLDVTARTGAVGVDPTRLTQLGLASPLPAVLPVTAVGQLSRLLSNRLIHLRVTGTVNNPSVQIEPLAYLAENAVRFFIDQAVPINLP